MATNPDPNITVIKERYSKVSRLADKNKSLSRLVARNAKRNGCKNSHMWEISRGTKGDRPFKVCVRCKAVRHLSNFEAALAAITPRKR